MLPVFAGGEIPSEVGGELMNVARLPDGRATWKQCLSRLTGIARIVAKREPKRIGIRKLPTEIPGRRNVPEEITRPLALRGKICCCGGVVELAQQAADLCRAVAGAESSGISLERDLGDGARAAMRKNLDHARHRVRTIQRARRTMHDLDLVDVVGREV